MPSGSFSKRIRTGSCIQLPDKEGLFLAAPIRAKQKLYGGLDLRLPLLIQCVGFIAELWTTLFHPCRARFAS
jgi:hypothetical protein